MLEDCGHPTCAATWRQSMEHHTLRRCLPRRGKTPSIDCQATCRKQLRSSAKQVAEADKILRSSYEVSRILARRMKPFSDGDFTKECIVTVVDFPTLISVLQPAMARSPSPADGHHYAPERRQRHAAGQKHSRNRHARTHHLLRGKTAIVGGAIIALYSHCCLCT